MSKIGWKKGPTLLYSDHQPIGELCCNHMKLLTFSVSKARKQILRQHSAAAHMFFMFENGAGKKGLKSRNAFTVRCVRGWLCI